MYLSIISTIVGILFILMGIAGFIPGFFENGLLFGRFEVDAIHSVTIFVAGVIALLASLKYKADRLFFQVFGILFGLLAIAGSVRSDLFITHVNLADTVLHFFLAVVFLVLGFSSNKEGRV